MNYYGARLIPTDEPTPDAGRYRYFSRRGQNFIAEGYCAQACDGHDTPEAAEQHFTDWLLDMRLSLNLADPYQEWRCEAPGCDVETHRRAECYGHVHPLCDAHMNRPTFAALMPRIGTHEATW